MVVTLVVALGAMVLTGVFGVPSAGVAHAQESDDALELARKHVPRYLVAPQPEECSPDGEAFAPMSVDAVLGNDDVLLRQVGRNDPIVTRAPTAADLADRGDGFYLDYPGVSVSPGCTYEQDYARYTRDLPHTVYARVVTQDGRPGLLALQYWTFWYFNDWNNTHESDWEFTQLLFEASTASEALGEDPVSVGYAQHEGGERADWDADKLERVGARPVVYPSTGSHASYFSEDSYLGRSASEGFGCDITLDAQRAIDPEVVLLPESVDDAGPDLAWLTFEGRWGERQSGPFNGPTGPVDKDRWDEPISWQDDLRADSVTLPGGSETNDTILDTFCSVVEFGSNQLRLILVTPSRALVLLGLVGLGIGVAVWRTDWSATPIFPLARRRRAGQMIRAAATAYFSTKGALLAFSAIYLPAALVVAVVGALTSFGVATTASALLTGLAYGAIVSLVTGFLARGRQGVEPVRAAFATTTRRFPQLVGTVALATGIVLALGLTVIGLPFAIRQAVRYQFAAAVVTREELAGMAALRRSSALVKGRWWQTAAVVAVFFGIGLFLSTLLQLLLLVAFAGLPLWAYVAATFLANGLFVPTVATAPVLLYGDALAAEAESDDAADAPVLDDDPEPALT